MRNNMSRIRRYLLILYKLRGKSRYVETEDLVRYLENQMSVRGDKSTISKRTIQRDIEEIYDIFGEEIKYKRGYGYHISERDDNPLCRYEDLLMDFDLLTSLDSECHSRGYLIPEHHRPKRSDNLPHILSAIKNHQELYFDYTLVRRGNAVISPIVRPYFLKESLGLWYLVGMDKDNNLKTYAIDRISGLQVLEKEFKRDRSIDPDRLFKDCFGIWDDPDMPVEEIELSYSALDGTFLKNNPLHSSQTVLKDTPEEFRIRLNLKITNDFVMALLSRSNSLTVIKPESLRVRIKEIYEKALERNK